MPVTVLDAALMAFVTVMAILAGRQFGPPDPGKRAFVTLLFAVGGFMVLGAALGRIP
ncbi:MAG: hypothetical protein AAFX39_09975 [Pseudomonadota bacterium]